MPLDRPIDILWVLLCTALVFLMQLGFLMLEAGAVRAKNTVNVAVKNLADLCLSSLIFWAFGFAMMFGLPVFPAASAAGGFGMAAFFLFQAAFCGTAATIVSGAVAERMSFRGYMATTAVITGLIYPVVGRWSWGGLGGGAPGWLETLGFVDFAGSTVVHSVGGWVALAAVLVIGPRQGRFFDARDRAFDGANLALSAGGGLVLWIGWMGFNGGSVLAMAPAVGGVLLATLMAGAAGGATATAFSALGDGRVPPMGLCNGVIAGLVAVTAGAHLASPVAAVLIGAVGAVAAALAGRLLERCRIDDPVGAVPSHLAAGMVGTLAVAFLMPGADPWRQLGVQALGVLVAGLWAFPLSYAALRLLDRVIHLRVAPEAESVGLSLAEHGTVSAMSELVEAMERQRQSGNFTDRVPVRFGEEAGIVAAQYNSVLGRIETEMIARERLAGHLAEARDAAEAASRAKSDFLAMMSHELRTPMNGILGLSAVLSGTRLDERQAELVRVLRQSGTGLVALLEDVLEVADAEAPGRSRHFECRVQLADLCAAVGERYRAEAEAKGLRFTMQCSDGATVTRRGDADTLARMFGHLVGNAVKFTETGSVEAQVTAGDAVATFVVRDTGCGIAPARQSRIFDPFIQSDSGATRRHGGAGLGLAVVKRLADALGGSVTLESREGGGSVFIVSIPCPLAESAAAATA
jgi:Amt family ammonium transporter